jgi:hypothetical protein
MQRPLLLASAFIVTAVASTVSAQFPKRVDALGKVHSFNAKQVNVMTAANEGWVFKLKEDTSVTYKAEGGPDLVVPKLAVRFRAVLDKRGNSVEPVAKFHVFTPKQFFQPLIEVAPPEEEQAEGGEKPKAEGQPDEPVGDKQAAQEAEEPAAPAAGSFDAALADASESGDEAATDDRSGRRGRAGRDDETEPGVEYEVIGVLATYRRGNFIVDCGDAGKVRGELTEDAAVTVELEGVPALRATKQGDEVHAEGYSSKPGEANAKVITITRTAPPEEDEEQEEARRGSRRRPRPAESEEAAENEEAAPPDEVSPG